MQKNGLMQKCLTGNVRLKEFGKTTDNNALPEGWIKKPLKELVEMAFSSVNKKSRSDEKAVQLCNYMDVYNNDYITDDLDFMTATASDREIEKFTLQQGDVIITKDSETPDDIGVPAVVMENLDNVICGYHLALLRPKQNEIDGIFLAKELARDRVSYQFSRVANGATRFGLTTDAVRNIQVNVPPLSEQKKIAHILRTWDRAIDLTERLIEAKEKRFKWLLKTLISDQQDNPEWQQVKLGEISNCYSGGTPSTQVPEYYDGEIPFINSGDLNQRHIKSVKGMLSILGVENSSAKFVEKNTLLMALYGATAGVVAITHIDAVINQAVLAIVVKENHDNNFIFFGLEQIKNILVKKYRQGGQPNLSAKIIKSIKLRLPSLPEQKRIANVLNTAKKEVEFLKQIVGQYRVQKRGLMQQLLTGNVRVKI